MRLTPIGRLLVTLVLLILPVAAFGQEATFTGVVTDSTGAVLPGVTITAVHTASGNTFTTNTDQRGEFRLPVRVGTYTISAELSGFTTVTRSLQILVGQVAPVNVQLQHLNPMFANLPWVPVVLQWAVALMVPVAKNGDIPPND